MMGRVLVVGLVFAAACASSSRINECDPNTSTCTDAGLLTPDAPNSVTVDAPTDAPKKGFGDPCTDSNQCESNICVLVATGGVCSALCNNDCPAGWGCFGVTGVIDPDQVTSVCVPISDQLCSPCVADSECTLIGMDSCVTETTGRKYCARDCSTVACPNGYDCSATKECVPHSGACDCNTATQAGSTDACTITTPLSTTCAGTSTCAGIGGWGACAPPSTIDNPDANYVDSNCDGIDGDASKGIFVAGGGTNSSTCGLAYNTPCQTISFGVVRGVQAGRPNVYVQAGTYNEVIVLLNGVNIWGGYDFNWQRGPYSSAAHKVTVVGAQDTTTGGDGEYLTVRAHDLIVGVTIDDMVLQGPNAQGISGSSGLDGRSSYVVHTKASTVTLSHVQIIAGTGATGGSGSSGPDASLADASAFMSGGTGGNGDEFTTTCNSSSRGGAGGGGVNSCSGRATNGGNGGQGGTMDTDCGVFSSNFDARPGDNGINAAFVTGVFGLHGNGGSGGGTCGLTSNGNPGAIANGLAGSGGGGGYLGGSNNLYWYAHAGGAGGTGENGSGGGGGGGGGGCDQGTDAYGAGGGGGGAGGCAARGGGGGGGGGGGAFGIFAVAASTVTIDTCDLFRGNAGSGGAGGSGGRGQSGGPAGLGGSAHPGSATPGNGGAGAHGGHGGGGGGGQAGRSVGVVQTPDSTITGTCTQSGGAAGSTGTGGASAPNAPAVERDGNNGGNGGAGSLESTRTCVSTASC